MVRQIARALAIRATGNAHAQAALARTVKRLNKLRGIGSGSYVESSGESALAGLVASSAGSRQAIVFDVGSNTGQFAEMFVSKYPGPLVVHCFEPSSFAHAALLGNLGSDRRFRINHLGMSSAPGTLTLHYDVPASGLASLYRRDLSHKPTLQPRHSEEIRLSTLDDYCSDHGVRRIHLLKIDTEGHELEVLKGARKLFEASAVDLTMFEFGGCNVDSRTFFRDFYAFFASYPTARVYRLTPSGFLDQIAEYSESLEQFGVTNYVVDFRRSTS